ncbi:MAG: sulfite exporter TauE/SafE family protein [Candidatus Parcubacteria bacterium]|nr:sulfite exporter TauE/SafE family protein [Burkholderiales bacterium]
MDWISTLAGFGVGIVVGLTGVGGGALMTPILVMVFGVAPHTAVGTDLLFASITKFFGAAVHQSRGTVDWQVVRRLAVGSVPAAAATASLLGWLGTAQLREGLILKALGLALVCTAVGLIVKMRLHAWGRRRRTATPAVFKAAQPALTVIAGVVLGVLVTLTSVGAGALGTVILVYLYPYRLTPAKLVGTDLAHAIPLALTAGAGHLLLGNVDFGLLGMLLIGSIPGILIGSLLSTRIPEHLVRMAIALVLLFVGARLLI